MGRIFLACLTVLLGVGCHKSNTLPDGGPALRPITGTLVEHFLLGGQVTDLAVDLSNITPLAMFENPDGTWSTYKGTGQSSGSFNIPAPPTGTYYLTLDFVNWYVGSQRTWDLGSYVFGRANVLTASPGTSLFIDAGSMTPWQATDDLQLISEGAGLTEGSFLQAMAFQVVGAVDAGATTFQQTFDYSLFLSTLNNVSAGLIAAGDQTYLTHLSTQAASPSVFYAASLVDALSTNTLTIPDVSTATLQQRFTTLAGDAGTLSATLKRSQYMALVNGMNPASPTVGLYTYLDAFPETTQYGFFAGAPDLVEVSVAPADVDGGQTDVALAYAFRNPYPSTWPLVAATSLTNTVTITLPGTDAGVGITAMVGTAQAYVPGATLAPIVGPVTQPMINSQSLFDPATLNGNDSPTLSWSAPTVGTATAYQVLLQPVVSACGTPVVFDTSDTRITIPAVNSASNFPPVFVPGCPYVALIRANAYPTAPTGPNYGTLPLGYADVVSGIIMP
jgi:hypothetical protein